MSPQGGEPNPKANEEISTGTGVVIFVIVIVAGLVVMGNDTLRELFGFSPASSSSASTPALIRASTPDRRREVLYRVSGNDTSHAAVTCRNAQGGTEQHKVELPWELPLAVEPGQFVYLSAQNQEEYGGVVVEILIEGKPWKKSESEGAHTIATASDNVPWGDP